MKSTIITFTAILVFTLASISLKLAAEREGYAVIVAVPTVDNDLLRKSRLLPDTLYFSDLPGTITDAVLFDAILKKEGFKEKNIIRLGFKPTDKVKTAAIIDALTTMGNKLKANGRTDNLFVFYYSGHGYQIKDQPGGDETIDHLDEVLVANNGFVPDDQINQLYQKYFKTTRNIMIMDACHAGSMPKIFLNNHSLQVSIRNSNLLSAPDCDISDASNADESINMIYYGSSLDENESFDDNGGYFTRSIITLYKKLAEWRTMNPKKLACMLSIQLQYLKDPGKGKIQYAEYGNLPDDFKNNYLFKIK